jgi:hypothetical protein
LTSRRDRELGEMELAVVKEKKTNKVLRAIGGYFKPQKR